MRSTVQIKERLNNTEIECKRISDILREKPWLKTHHYVLSNGVASNSDWTYDDALTVYVAKKLELKWILCIND